MAITDAQALLEAVNRLVAQDFDVAPSVDVADPELAQVARAVEALASTLRREMVSARHVEGMFSATPTAMVQLQPDGRIAGLNQAALTLLGSGLEGAPLGEVLADLVEQEDAPIPTLAELSDGVSMTLLDPEGESAHVVLRLAPLLGRFHQVEGHILSVTDVTDQVLARARVEQTARERTRFLARVSHEFRTPLNGILGVTQALQAEGMLDHQIEFQLVERCCQELLSLVDGVLDFSRLEDAEDQHLGELKPPEEPAQRLIDGHGMSVLVVDDNPINRLVAGRLLTQLGCTVREAEHGALALEAIRESVPDLVLMDRDMPIMGGIEAVRQLRVRWPTLPVVALTASALPSERALCLEAGMDDFLTKPIQRSELERVLAQLQARGAA